MSRFRSAGFRNGWTAGRRASGPIAGGLHGGGAPHFAMGGPHRGGGPHGTPAAPRNAVSPWEVGARRKRRFTVGGGGKSVARCHRMVLAYWKFESSPLQRRLSAN
jgi:hypothetical protein